MPYNGSGVFQRVRNWVADATAGIKIRADYHDAEDDGFAAGLTNAITRDGQTLITQNIPFNNKRITGLADPINDQDAATKKSVDTKIAAPGTLTGDILISKSAPLLSLSDTGTAGAGIYGRRNNLARWFLRLGNDDAETGGSAGGNLDLHRYADDGAYGGRSLLINRASGMWTINGAVTVNGDLHADRGDNEGAIFLGTNSLHYLYWGGGAYALPGGPLSLGAPASVGGHAVTLDQLNTKQTALGFTPVRQGGGYGQGTNTVYIGWSVGSGLKATVDNTDLGVFSFGSDMRLGAAHDEGCNSHPSGEWYEFQGACVGFMSAWGAGYPIPNAFRFRPIQVFKDGNWVTIGY